MKDWIRLTAQGRLKFRMLSMMMVLILTLAFVPNGAWAAVAVDGLTLGTTQATITQGKVKIEGISGDNTFWASPGQEDAEVRPDEGTSFSGLATVYSINLSHNPFVPAVAGNTISVVEVDSGGVVVGYKSLLAEARHIGTVSLGVNKYEDIYVIVGNNRYVSPWDLYTTPNRLDVSIIEISDPTVVSVQLIANRFVPEVNDIVLTSLTAGTTTVSFDIEDRVTHDKNRRTLIVNSVVLAPQLNITSEYKFVDSAIGLGFVTNNVWTGLIKSIEVDGVEVSEDSYTITDSEILFNAGVLSEGQRRIVIKADGYSDAEIYIFMTKSTQTFYMDEPVINMSDGISVSVEVLDRGNYSNKYNKTATAVFQLMDGDVPVATNFSTIVSTNSFQSFSTHFDVAMNPNYSVRVFMITGDNMDVDHLGYNLATKVTAAEFDIHYLNSQNDMN